MAMGILNLGGVFFELHRDEVLSLVFKVVGQQESLQPMKRITDIEDTDNGGVMIAFTDNELPKCVGEAILQAHEGELDYHYPEASDVVHATWVRQS